MDDVAVGLSADGKKGKVHVVLSTTSSIQFDL